MNAVLGIAGQIFAILAFGLVVAVVVQFLVRKVASFRPSYESTYTAVIAGYLAAFALATIAGALGMTGGIFGAIILYLAGFAIQVYAYARIITGPNGEKLKMIQSVIVSLLQAVIGLLAIALVFLIFGNVLEAVQQ